MRNNNFLSKFDLMFNQITNMKDTELEVIISMINPFEIYTDGVEVIEKYGKFENKRILAGDWEIECVIVATPIWDDKVLTHIDNGHIMYSPKKLVRIDVSCLDATLYKGEDQERLTIKQTLTLETAIENKITAF